MTPHWKKPMNQNDERNEGESRLAQRLVSWNFDWKLSNNSFFADEIDHDTEGEDGDEDGDESAVHVGDEKIEHDLCTFRRVVKLNIRYLLIDLLLNHRILHVVALAHPSHAPLVETIFQRKHQQTHNRGDERCDYHHSHIVRRHQGVPVWCEIAEYRHPTEIHEVYEF